MAVQVVLVVVYKLSGSLIRLLRSVFLGEKKYMGIIQIVFEQNNQMKLSDAGGCVCYLGWFSCDGEPLCTATILTSTTITL